MRGQKAGGGQQEKLLVLEKRDFFASDFNAYFCRLLFFFFLFLQFYENAGFFLY